MIYYKNQNWGAKDKTDRVFVKQGTYVPRNTTPPLTNVRYTSLHLSLSPVLSHLSLNYT